MNKNHFDILVEGGSTTTSYLVVILKNGDEENEIKRFEISEDTELETLADEWANETGTTTNLYHYNDLIWVADPSSIG